MPYCKLFKHGCHVHIDSTVAPCCKWSGDRVPITDDYHKQFDEWGKQSESKWLPQCEECERDEQVSIPSHRQQFNQMPLEGVFYDLKISSLCNLSCRMCWTESSSQWVSIVKNNPHLKFAEEQTVINHNTNTSITDVEMLLPIVNDCEILKFTGGEPMYIPQVKQILEHCVSIGRAKHIDLRLTTNITQPIDAWWQNIFNQFKSVYLTCSIDGVGSRYEYIRGFDFGEIEKNITALGLLPTVSLGVSCLDMTITVGQKPLIADYWRHQNVNFHFASVYFPKFFSFESLSPRLRQQFGVSFDHAYSQSQWIRLCEQMAVWDSIRHTDFQTECSELF